MNINWQNIWDEKGSASRANYSLNQLISLNGFDTGCGFYREDQWGKLIKDFIDRTGLKPQNKVLEIGCGSGAFLYALNQSVRAKYFGLDYSLPLINVAKHVLKEAKFSCSEAADDAFSTDKFDIIFSHSVFHYFDNLEYAYKVLEKWAHKLSKGGKFVLMDVNDITFQKEYHTIRKKGAVLSGSYDKKYKFLEHLFLNKQDLKNKLVKLNMHDIEFFPHSVKEYGNSRFRFNVICTKAG